MFKEILVMYCMYRGVRGCGNLPHSEGSIKYTTFSKGEDWFMLWLEVTLCGQMQDLLMLQQVALLGTCSYHRALEG
jgi:hypothetical protein